MPRKKLSEYRAKVTLHKYLDQDYLGFESIKSSLPKTLKANSYVVKVDQAVKKRGKQGLVSLSVDAKDAAQAINKFQKLGYDYALVEPFVEHKQKDEKYLSLRLTRDGIQVVFSPRGGVEVEGATDKMMSFSVAVKTKGKEIAEKTKLSHEFISLLLSCMKENYFSFVELNPLLVNGNNVTVLDMAVEVDDAGAFFVDSWDKSDFRFPKMSKKTRQEEKVEELNNTSQASFRLKVLNPDGAIFMLLSGGGASITLADEIYNQGYGGQLANYGEYSGAPNREETKHYTQQLIELLLKSKAKNKVLIIAGAVANFTDVFVTFQGIIDTLKNNATSLKQQNIKVFVRRGGPNEIAGLNAMSAFLGKNYLLGHVAGTDTPLTDIVNLSLENIHV